MNARSFRFSLWCCRIGAANGERMAHEVGGHVGPEGISLRPADLRENRAQDGSDVAGCEAGGDVHAKVARACADTQNVAKSPFCMFQFAIEETLVSCPPYSCARVGHIFTGFACIQVGGWQFRQ